MSAVLGASPCVSVCVMDTGAGICLGCGRTLAEIGGWLSFTATERDAINTELSARLEALVTTPLTAA